MAFEIPSSGSIDLGGTSDRSIAALANVKGNFNETSSVHLSGMRDWYRTYVGEDNAENLPMAGDGISLGDFREAAVFGVEVRTRNESKDTNNYKNNNNARIYVRGIDGSGSYQFQLVQTTGASKASYIDTGSSGDTVTIEAVNPGPDGNDIELTGTGSSPATFSGNSRIKVSFTILLPCWNLLTNENSGVILSLELANLSERSFKLKSALKPLTIPSPLMSPSSKSNLCLP